MAKPNSALTNSTMTLLELNVGGSHFTTTKDILTKDGESKLAEWFRDAPGQCPLPTDSQGRIFIDRDGQLFRYILDGLRSTETTPKIVLPEGFTELHRLRQEAEFYKLNSLLSRLTVKSAQSSVTGRFDGATEAYQGTDSIGYLTVGYHGTFSFGRQGLAADVNFRKISRILVCGRVSLCREVFADSLNEGRDPDRGHNEDRYTARYFLKHNFLEQAFDNLLSAGFRMVSSCGTGTSGPNLDMGSKSSAAGTSEEDRWAHYNEFIFCRP